MLTPPLSLGIAPKNRGENFGHGISVDEILATLYFLPWPP